MSSPVAADVILVGGGLANTLIALALRSARPHLRLLLLEQGPTLGGNHTWSFHSSDVTPAQRAALGPLIAASWPRQEVRFPGHRRIIETGYNSISSQRLHAYACDRLGASVRLGAIVAAVTPGSVTLADRTTLQAALVIDGRGQLASDPLALGYQKFVGLEVETSEAHRQMHPIIMDATVPQADGYRFVYTLPLSPTRLLIEDTCYSDTPGLDRSTIETRIERYAADMGWTIARIVRREQGVLPIALAGDIDRHWQGDAAALPRSGLRAWLFHATTGYSLPNAVRLAEAIARSDDLTSAAVAAMIEQHARRHWHDQRLFRLLNRFLFVAADPSARVRVLERFYRLPQPVIERFYASALNRSDVARLMAVMAAKPPVGMLRALSAMSETAGWQFAARHRAKRSELS